MSGRAPLHVVGAAILRAGRCLVAQRGPGMSLPGFWEFPGGKVEARESPQKALVRELREELGVGIEVGPWIGRGESRAGDREVVLDVYAASLVDGEPTPIQHAQLRWIRADEIATLAWPEADRPVLSLLHRLLARGLEAKPAAGRVPIVSVDWASRVAGRAVAVARPTPGGWHIGLETAPEAGWSFATLLDRAEQVAEPFGGGALVAIDAVLGLPLGYGIRAEAEGLVARGSGFASAMAALDASGALVARASSDPRDWSIAKPFFAVPPGAGGLGRFIERAGGRAILQRQLERATGAKPVFAKSGIPGSVGSGSAVLWRELLAARRAAPDRFRLWPFEVELELEFEAPPCPPRPARITIAESYPRACYAVALADALPTRPRAIAKGDPKARRRHLDALERADWTRERRVSIEGRALAEASEDAFDALFQAAALVRLVDAGFPLASPLVDPVWEGGILGTGGLTLAPPRVRRAHRAHRSA